MNIFVNRIRVFLAVLTLVIITSLGYAQSCYVQMADATGVTVSTSLSELEAAACELRQSIPQEFQADFAVYDFGFYSFNKVMVGGSQSVFDNLIQEIDKPYYLVFGREIGDGRTGYKLWFDLKLPSVNGSPCNEKGAYIIDMLNETYNPIADPYNVGQTEIDAMQLVQILKTCEICDNGIDDDGDGFVDCDDLDCTYFAFSSAKENPNQANRITGCVVPTASQVDCILEYYHYLEQIGVYDFETTIAFCDELAALLNAPTNEPDPINNGITIVSSSVPSQSLLAGVDTLASTRYRHPHIPPYRIAPDMEHGTTGDVAVISESNKGQLTWTDQELEENMSSLLSGASLGVYDDISGRFASRFYGGTGEEYYDADISLAILETTVLKNSVKEFGADLETQLELNNGDIWQVPQLDLVPGRRPQFSRANGYLLKGPTILLNDVEQISYYVHQYSIDSLGNWEGEFYVEVIDHFGLDDADPRNEVSMATWFGTVSFMYQFLNDGFASWWILQHRRDYLPFRTRMRFLFTLKGKIDMP